MKKIQLMCWRLLLGRTWIVSFFGLVASLTLFPAGAVASNKNQRPNLILILADDLGHGDLSCHGSTEVRTPHLDRLAAEGVMMTRMRANCTVCSPTRAAIMTGVYPDRAGVPGVIRTHADNSWGYFSSTTTTIASRLSNAGYDTAIIGKWHLGLAHPNTPNDRGFRFFHGFLGDMMDDYYNHRREAFNYMRLNTETIDPYGHATELFTQWSIDYLDERAAKPNEPFFLYVPYNAPHFPIQPPAAWEQKVCDRLPNVNPNRSKNIAFVQHLDDQIGRLLKHIDDLELSESTVVAFTSDNGGSLRHFQNNDPWRDGKQSHFDGGLRVPCFIRFPREIEPGTKNNQPALTFDLGASFLSYAGLPIPSDFDAVDLRPVIAEETSTHDRELYFVRREGGMRYGGKAYHALIQGRWKLMQNDPHSPMQLYNLESDPEERQDVLANHREIAQRMSKRLSSHIQRGGRTAWQPPSENETQ